MDTGPSSLRTCALHPGVLIYNVSSVHHFDHLHQVCTTLKEASLYTNLKNCSYFVDKVIFLSYVVSSKGVSADPKKVKAIVKWLEPCTIHEDCSFHGLATFYRCFVKGFSIFFLSICVQLYLSQLTFLFVFTYN